MMLKPHVRDKRLYGTLTISLCWSPWLIPHNVLLNAQNAGSADKRTRTHGRPNYITREPGFEPYMQQGCCIQRLFDTLANHCTHNMRPHCHLDWRMEIGCAMVAERWDGPMRNHHDDIFLCRDSCLAHVLTQGIHTQTNFTSEKTAASACAIKALIMRVWLFKQNALHSLKWFLYTLNWLGSLVTVVTRRTGVTCPLAFFRLVCPTGADDGVKGHLRAVVADGAGSSISHTLAWCTVETHAAVAWNEKSQRIEEWIGTLLILHTYRVKMSWISVKTIILLYTKYWPL